MTTTSISDTSQTFQSNNPFRTQSLATAGNSFAPNDIVSDLEASEETTTEEEEEVEPDQPRRPGMYDRQRSLSGNSSSSSKPFKLRRKPPPPPPRPIFPPAQDDTVPISYVPPPGRPTREALREKGSGTDMTDLEKQEKILLQRAIEESKRESTRRETTNSDEDDQLRRALEASRREARADRAPTISSQESDQIERALALSSAEQESRLPRSSNTPSPTKPIPSSSSSTTPTRPSRVRSESGPEALPPFPFTEEDLVRPSYPKEKSHLFPQGLPSLPPGAGTTQDEYEREMEMLTLAIRMSEEEERLRQEREERELREVVRRVEEKENAALGSKSKATVSPRQTSPPSSAESANGETTSPTSSPKTKRSWFRPPLASKYSTATSPPASPPLSPESITRPGLEATPTDSTTRSNATSFQSAAESLPFTNLISTTTVPNDLSSRIESSKPQRRPPAPPHPTRLPPSPPETPIVASTTSFAPPIPPLPAPYARSRQNTNESDRGGPFLPAHSEAFRNENAGSPVEMPYLTPSASNSIRSMQRGENGRLSSWALEERNGSGGSGSGGSRSESTSGHSRVNSTNRRSSDVAGVSGMTPQSRSEDGEGSAGRRSFEEGDDFRDEDQASIESQVQLAIRNPDSSPAPPLELQHQGGFVSEPPAVDVPRDVEAGDPYLEGLDGPIFESAYAGRSMSAIDEQTEPASSIVAEDGFSRQGSYPSTDGGSLDPTIHRGETERVLEGLQAGGAGGEEMRTSITYHPRPMDEREWMHESVLRRPSQPPLSDSLTPTPPRRDSPPEINETSQPHARQITASSTAITESSAGPRLSFPLPPFSSTLPPTSASPVESSLTSTTVPTTRPESSGELLSSPSNPASASPTSFADGTRFGHPSICAREPGHVCPHDGLSSQQEVPESIELTALMDEREPSSVGLRLHRHSTRRREETGGKSILRDAWAVEARNWGSLLRFLMWYGDTRIVASPQDVALEPSRHCTAAASLEFRPDDEGYTIIRLVVTILPPDDPDSHSHRELTVEHPATTPPAHSGKGKGKSRSYFHSSSSAPSQDPSSLSSLATFQLPDSVHLPCRLSNLAIQLYTLRHLASIARSTQPAKEGGTASYQALRELSIALENLTSIAQSRLERDASSHQGPSHYRAQSGGGGGMNRSDENERLLTRLRDRLRRLKRGGGGPTNENSYPNTSPTKPNKLVKAPPTRRETNPQSRDNFAALTQTVQPLPRTERVLSANDHDHDDDDEDEENRVEEIGSGNGSGSGNHLEVDGARWSMVRRDPETPRRDRIPEEWENRRNLNVVNETSYMPILRS
ncbi:hypothetical protein JCM3765_000245 [Sporobolomyces pararoseus]